MTHPIAGVRPPLPEADGLLAGLTPEQARAVTHGSGPLLLLAGPGAGKTKTLTHRAAYLLATTYLDNKRWSDGIAAAQRFTWPAFADRLVAIYEDVACGRQRVPQESPDPCPA